MHAFLTTNCSYILLGMQWPDFHRLPLFDMFCSLVDRAVYIRQGREFVRKIGVLSAEYKTLSTIWQ